jgi:predicted ATP-dependent serine protease
MHRSPAVPAIFVCKACGHVHQGWRARCESCEAWSSAKPQATITRPHEQPFASPTSRGSTRTSNDNRKGERAARINHQVVDDPHAEPEEQIEDDVACIPISKVDITDIPARIKTGIEPLDHVLGGGAVLGEMILLAGDPGCGKSTMLGMVGKNLSPDPVVYASGEENEIQVATRHQRIGAICDSILFTHETDIDKIIRRAEKERAKVLIVDSLQTLHDNGDDVPRGKQNQLVYCTEKLMNWAKRTNVPVFLICHINKKQDINGPKAVEHFVDVSLMMRPSGETSKIRHLFSLGKNRFGATENHGSFVMSSEGRLEPLPIEEDHGFIRDEEEDDMTPIAQELLHLLLESGIPVDKGMRERISNRLDFTPRSR